MNPSVMEILSEPVLVFAFRWLGDFFKFEWQHLDWESHGSFPEEGAFLYLFPPSWRLLGIDGHLAFSFPWSNESNGDAPEVQLYLPAKEQFPQRNQLLNQIRPQLKRAAFILWA
jgi:hypothetical protein